MIREPSFRSIAGLMLCAALGLLPGGQVWSDQKSSEGATREKIVRNDSEWRKRLTAEQYRVTRQKGTERAFSGAYDKSKQDGIYRCVCCRQPLFDSKTKFDSKTGWPSYWQPIDEDAVIEHDDNSGAVPRTEIVCSRCDAHLGHVFDDGPKPTGLRYCINSVSLKFTRRELKPAEKP